MQIKVKRKWVILGLLDLLLILPAIYYTDLTRIIMILTLLGNGVIIAFDNLNDRSCLLAFLIAFFTFLVGRQALERFHLYDVENVFSENLNEFAERLLLISLVVLLITFLIMKAVKISGKNTTREIDYSSVNYQIIRKVSRAFFLMTFAFNIFSVMDIVLFVIRHGYVAFYTSYSSGVPYIVRKIGEMSPVCYWIYLSTMPDKKSTGQLTKLYIVYLIITLGTGKRFPFVAGLLTVFVYYFSRNKINNRQNEIWFGRKQMRLFFIGGPLILFVLFAIGQVRSFSNADSLNITSFVTDFIYDQGSSINVIKRMIKYQEYLPQGKMYLFGSTYEALCNNVIFRLLGAEQYAGNTVAHAMQGYSMQHALSYICMGSYYLAGHGIGSCYIAEAFHDYGYIGVILVNIGYGIIFSIVFDFKNLGIWSSTFTLLMLYSLLLAPRGSADGFITVIIDLTTWGTMLVVWLISKLLISRYNTQIQVGRKITGDQI